MSSTEREAVAVERAAQALRERYVDGGSTIVSAVLRAISTLRKTSHEHEALDLENALRLLGDVAGDHAAAELPEHLRESLDAHVRLGRLTGGFLEAVLCNDLREALGRADPISLRSLPAIIRYLRDNAPAVAWGSVDKVRTWQHERPWRDDVLRDFDVAREL